MFIDILPAISQYDMTKDCSEFDIHVIKPIFDTEYSKSSINR